MADRKKKRRCVKKLLSVFFSILLCCLSLNMGQAAAADIDQNASAAGETTKPEQSSDAKNIWEQWKNGAVQIPESGALVPAGPIKVQWEALEGLPWETVSYRVYLDDDLAGEVEAEEGKSLLFCEVYTTKTASHQVKIEAVLENERIVTTSIRTFFVSKKGLGIPTEAKTMAQDMNGSWYYNWSESPDSRVKEELDFVPMIWNDYADGITWLLDAENHQYGTVLGYNEPDRTKQANLSVQTAASNQQYFTDSGLRIGAPAVSGLPHKSEWFQSYAEAVNMDEIDFIPIHCYPGWTDGKADDFLAALDEIYELYKKPVWITEFAIARWDGDYLWYNGTDEENNQKVREFMQEAVKGLEAREYVERYAWQQFDLYDWAGGASALYDQNTGELTTLGLLYRGIGNPEGYVLPNLDGTANAQNVSDLYVEEVWQEPDDGENIGPGTNDPGDGSNGTNPGTNAPGNGDNSTDPGTNTPGTNDPGTGDNGTDPGTNTPGTNDPGNGDNGTDPGTNTPGTNDPGTGDNGTDPGTNTPGTNDPGTGDNGTDPGTNTPGTNDPGTGDNGTDPGTNEPGDGSNGAKPGTNDPGTGDNGTKPGTNEPGNGSDGKGDNVPDNNEPEGGHASSDDVRASGGVSAPKTGDYTAWAFPAAGLFLSALMLEIHRRKREK